jgi:hypothetical protein
MSPLGARQSRSELIRATVASTDNEVANFTTLCNSNAQSCEQIQTHAFTVNHSSNARDLPIDMDLNEFMLDTDLTDLLRYC